LFALREASNLTGTKNGCATGHCGACTVHVDGRAVRSCQAKIGELEGSLVTTIEGLAQNRSHPIQQAFLANNVVQCGFCVPGMIMAIAALIDRGERPGDAEVDAAITNICRCGIYPRLREAIRGALATRSRWRDGGSTAAAEQHLPPVPTVRRPPRPIRRRLRRRGRRWCRSDLGPNGPGQVAAIAVAMSRARGGDLPAADGPETSSVGRPLDWVMNSISQQSGTAGSPAPRR
jgi:isoquinoline 1-oxidoreductase alpha subunit